MPEHPRFTICVVGNGHTRHFAVGAQTLCGEQAGSRRSHTEQVTCSWCKARLRYLSTVVSRQVGDA